MRTCAVGVVARGGTANEKVKGVVIAFSTPQTLAVPTSDGSQRVVRVSWSQEGLYVHKAIEPDSTEQGYRYLKSWMVATESGFFLMGLMRTKTEAVAAARRFLPLANWHQPASVLQSCPSLRRDVLALRRMLLYDNVMAQAYGHGR